MEVAGGWVGGWVGGIPSSSKILIGWEIGSIQTFVFAEA